jgi:hypothetical protein
VNTANKKRWIPTFFVFAVLFLAQAVVPAPVLAQGIQDEEGVVVRVGGDIDIEPGESEAVVVVVRGNATIRGEVGVVVVVNGTATLVGARADELVVVQGKADLTDGTEITGNVELINSELSRSSDVVIGGEVVEGSGKRFGRGMLLFGILVGLGFAIAVIVSGLVAAAVAPHGVRAAGEMLTHEFGKTVIGTLAVWIGLPIIAIIAFMTVVGIPTGIGIFLFLLPALGFLGYLISGIRLGDYLLGIIRGSDEAWHPYLAAIVGLLTLLLMGFVPVVGSVVSPIAGMFGAGALAARAFEVARKPPRPGLPLIA